MDLSIINTLLKRREERIGIDFDSRSTRVVKLKMLSEHVFEVAACGMMPVSIKQTTPLDQQRVGLFLKQMSGGLTKAALTIEDPSLRIRRMDFAKMPERDLIEAIKWNFREHIDCPIEDYQVGYTQIDGSGDAQRTAYVAYGVSKKAVKEHTDLAKLYGLKAVALEPQATALLAAFNYNINWEPQKYFVCIVLGEEISYFTVMSEGQLLFSRPMTAISCDVLLKLISRTMNVEESTAQEILSKCMQAEEQDENLHPEFLETRNIFFSQLAIETQRSIDAFSILFGVDRVDKIYLCGPGAYCPQIAAHMQKTLGVRTKLFDPFAKMNKEKLHESIWSRSAVFAVAFGLAIP